MEALGCFLVSSTTIISEIYLKVKLSHNTHMEAQEERRYSSYLFMRSTLDRVSG
jgi:hypothetical protein